jgi:hypothetical protein
MNLISYVVPSKVLIMYTGQISVCFIKECPEIATISFKSLGTDATKPLNFNKRQSPRPLFNVVSHFSSGLMFFGLSNVDWGGGRGRGAVLCVKNCNDPLTS